MQSDMELLWEDVEGAAESMFNTWFDGSEVEWAKECWGHFHNEGLTKANGILEETTAKIRLLALAWYYLDFCLLKWQEGYDGAYRDVQLIAEDLELNQVALGILAASDDPTGFNDVDNETTFVDYALQAAIRSVRAEIHDCLIRAYGDPVDLYSRMCRTIKPIDVDSDPEDNFEPGPEDEFEPNGYNMRAFAFVQDGFIY